MAGSCSTVSSSCGAYECAGTTACHTSCGSDSDCAAGRFCSGGSCVPKLSNGTSCTAGTQCSSGQCVDGVCCNTACEGWCEACSGLGSNGTCAIQTNVSKLAETRLAEAANQPSITWTGSEFITAWATATGSEIWMRRHYSDGTFVVPGASRIASGTGGGSQPDVVWSGSQLGVSFIRTAMSGAGTTHLLRVSPTGSPIGDAPQIGMLGSGIDCHRLAWNADVSRYSDVATDQSSAVILALATSGAVPSGSRTIVTGSTACPSMVASAGTLAVVWDDGGSAFLKRLTADGDAIGSTLTISTEGLRPIIGSRGDELAVVYGCGTNVCFRRISLTGTPVGNLTSFPGSWPVELTWTGNRWLVAWHHLRSLNPFILDVRLRQLTPDGTPVGDVITPAVTQGGSAGARMAWSGGDVAVVMSADNGIHYSRLGCQ